MQRLISLLVVALMALSLVGCANRDIDAPSEDAAPPPNANTDRFTL